MPMMISQKRGASYYTSTPPTYTNLGAHMSMMISQRGHLLLLPLPLLLHHPPTIPFTYHSYYLYPSYYTNLVAHMPMMISQKRAPPTTPLHLLLHL